jgi:two-component system LytT family response regulator
MKVVIVDDERLARGELRRLLGRDHPQVEIVGEAANWVEAVHLIGATRPTLVLLDIQMPGGTGFDVLAELDVVPQVIFTTAFDQYAIDAFKVNALDYLLKPIEPQRLQQALARVRQSSPERLYLRDGARCWLVAPEEITLFESEGNYTRVVMDKAQPLVLRSLSQFEQVLDPAHFVRASRKHIVNLDQVDAMQASPSGGLVLVLRDGRTVPMSRRRTALLRKV